MYSSIHVSTCRWCWYQPVAPSHCAGSARNVAYLGGFHSGGRGQPRRARREAPLCWEDQLSAAGEIGRAGDERPAHLASLDQPHTWPRRREGLSSAIRLQPAREIRAAFFPVRLKALRLRASLKRTPAPQRIRALQLQKKITEGTSEGADYRNIEGLAETAEGPITDLQRDTQELLWELFSDTQRDKQELLEELITDIQKGKQEPLKDFITDIQKDKQELLKELSSDIQKEKQELLKELIIGLQRGMKEPLKNPITDIHSDSRNL
ncbi:hypothetical protein NDU88_000905 [Pleurodeles waltl]|uniref:Uncharacterized protein n=1 Tax=Pleurodeles waltl TaxID=8319 RepID=A0AAV7U6K7_PLEWA|nr:hypothetical protein NDU88_000905 [Pleurodeles waltl]